MPTDDHLSRECELFEQALALPVGGQRESFLEQACAGDLALRRRLDALLAAHEQPDGVLPTRAETPPAFAKTLRRAKPGPL